MGGSSNQGWWWWWCGGTPSSVRPDSNSVLPIPSSVLDGVCSVQRTELGDAQLRPGRKNSVQDGVGKSDSVRPPSRTKKFRPADGILLARKSDFVRPPSWTKKFRPRTELASPNSVLGRKNSVQDEKIPSWTEFTPSKFRPGRSKFRPGRSWLPQFRLCFGSFLNRKWYPFWDPFRAKPQ